MDTDIAPASLASGRAVPIGAECGGGVHDAPPGSAWKHCHEEYGWTPVCFTTSPHHGLVWSYLAVRPERETRIIDKSYAHAAVCACHQRIGCFEQIARFGGRLHSITDNRDLTRQGFDLTNG